MGSRKKELALVVCLLLLATGITIESQSLVPPLFGLKVPAGLVSRVSGTATTHSVGAGSGELLVRVFSNIGYNLESSGSNTTVSADVPPSRLNLTGIHFSVVADGHGPFSPNIYATNSSGELELTLEVSNYSILFYDLPMNTSVPVYIHQNERTDLNLTISGTTYRMLYLNVPTDQDKLVPQWSRGTIEVGSPVPLFGSTAAFLDVHYLPALAVPTQVESPLLITGSEVRTSGAPSAATPPHEWIGFRTMTSISLAGVSSIGLSVFRASAAIAMHPMSLQTGGNPVAR